MGLNLAATAYVATEAFASIAMHLTKTIVYNKFSLIGKTELFYGIFIGIAMVLGSWAGRNIVKKLSRQKFILIVEVLLVIAGLQMIIAGIG